MKLHIDIAFKEIEKKIRLQDSIMLVGSCFAENIRNNMYENGFSTYFNSHGIIFNPISVCNSLYDVIEKKTYTEQDLFFLHETWNSWHHHSSFSHPSKSICLEKINASIAQHHAFLKKASVLIITLGSCFAYKHIEHNFYVANNHRAPEQTFSKELLGINDLERSYKQLLLALKKFNPYLQVIFTISPVRHTRDGVIENNRSKARLIELVHSLVANNEDLYYFPSYELVIDVLRDYRFFDIDLVHPNYAASNYVWEVFKEKCIAPTEYSTMLDIEKIHRAMKHKSSNKESMAHKKFKQEHLLLCQQISATHPYIDLNDAIAYFNT